MNINFEPKLFSRNLQFGLWVLGAFLITKVEAKSGTEFIEKNWDSIIQLLQAVRSSSIPYERDFYLERENILTALENTGQAVLRAPGLKSSFWYGLSAASVLGEFYPNLPKHPPSHFLGSKIVKLPIDPTLLENPQIKNAYISYKYALTILIPLLQYIKQEWPISYENPNFKTIANEVILAIYAKLQTNRFRFDDDQRKSCFFDFEIRNSFKQVLNLKELMVLDMDESSKAGLSLKSRQIVHRNLLKKPLNRSSLQTLTKDINQLVDTLFEISKKNRIYAHRFETFDDISFAALQKIGSCNVDQDSKNFDSLMSELRHSRKKGPVYLYDSCHLQALLDLNYPTSRLRLEGVRTTRWQYIKRSDNPTEVELSKRSAPMRTPFKVEPLCGIYEVSSPEDYYFSDISISKILMSHGLGVKPIKREREAILFETALICNGLVNAIRSQLTQLHSLQ